MIVKLSRCEELHVPRDLITPVCTEIYNHWNQERRDRSTPSLTAFDITQPDLDHIKPQIGMVSLLEELIVINYWGPQLLNWFGEQPVHQYEHLVDTDRRFSLRDMFREASESNCPVHASVNGAVANKTGLFESLFLPVDRRPNASSSSPFVVCAFGYIGS